MGLFFRKHDPKSCCLCGDRNKLTGEHKIKSSELWKEFGQAELTIRKGEDTSKRPKLVQSAGSKRFKFTARICEACNSARTQGADNEFVAFSRVARAKLANGEDPASVFELERNTKGTVEYLNVFRYFSKLLCCHMAEFGAPSSRRLSSFAIGKSNSNPVWLAVQGDWKYHQTEQHIGDFRYAAHGGLVVFGDKSSGDACAFHSTLTLGSLQFVFFTRIVWAEKLELRLAYPAFSKWCESQVPLAKANPLTEAEQKSLGLVNWK